MRNCSNKRELNKSFPQLPHGKIVKEQKVKSNIFIFKGKKEVGWKKLAEKLSLLRWQLHNEG